MRECVSTIKNDSAFYLESSPQFPDVERCDHTIAQPDFDAVSVR